MQQARGRAETFEPFGTTRLEYAKKRDTHRISLSSVAERPGTFDCDDRSGTKTSNRLSQTRLEHTKKGHPHWISSHLEHETGFEPATLALARRYSTTEPLVHTYLQNHILKSSLPLHQPIFTASSTNQTFLDKPSTD